MNTPKQFKFITGLSVIAFGISVYQTWAFFQLRNGRAGFDSFCNIGSLFNCQAVESSPYAEIFAGYPLSALAAAAYLMIFAISLFGLDAYWRRETTRALVVLTGLSTLFSIVYFGIMISALGVLCLLCLVIDVINLVLFGLVLSLKPEMPGETPFNKKQWKPFAGLSAGALVVMLIAASIMDTGGLSASERKEYVNDFFRGKVEEIKVSDQDLVMGPASAPVTIVKFSDFQCPMCKSGALALHPLKLRYKDQIRVVIKNFPLDSACNREVKTNMHPVACEAAYGAFCAKKQGVFEAYYKKVFEVQADLGSGKPLDVLTELGAPRAEMESCIQSQDTKDLVLADVEDGIAREIRGTPTFFINGRRFMFVSSGVLNDIVETILSKDGA